MATSYGATINNAPIAAASAIVVTSGALAGTAVVSIDLVEKTSSELRIPSPVLILTFGSFDTGIDDLCINA